MLTALAHTIHSSSSHDTPLSSESSPKKHNPITSLFTQIQPPTQVKPGLIRKLKAKCICPVGQSCKYRKFTNTLPSSTLRTISEIPRSLRLLIWSGNKKKRYIGKTLPFLPEDKTTSRQIRIPHGRGMMITPQSIYLGTFVLGSKHGVGTYTQDNVGTYTGQMKNNKANGHGTATNSKGVTCTGPFKDGKPSGRMTFTNAAGVKRIVDYSGVGNKK